MATKGSLEEFMDDGSGRQKKSSTKAKRDNTRLVLNDVVLKTLVVEKRANLLYNDGIMLIVTQDGNKPYFLPHGINIHESKSGCELGVYIRTLTDEVILDLGKDDIFEGSEFKEKRKKVVLLDDWEEVESIYAERKVEAIKSGFARIGTFVSGILLAIVCGYIYFDGSIFGTVSITLGILGCLYGVYSGLLKSIKCFKEANASIIVDSAGNWVNMDNGCSSLNGGISVTRYYDSGGVS